MNICRNKDGSRVGGGTKIEKTLLLGSCGGGGAPLYPEPDLWVAEMTDGGPLQLKVISEKKPCHFSPPLSRGRINKARPVVFIHRALSGAAGRGGKMERNIKDRNTHRFIYLSGLYLIRLFSFHPDFLRL